MQANYDPESGYHTGSIAEQEAKAQLGVFKRINDVSSRYYLGNFAAQIDADEMWMAFCEDDEIDWRDDDHRYNKAWYSWCDFCESHDVHPALPDPADVDEWLWQQLRKDRTTHTTHDVAYRPIFRFFQWALEHTEYPHRYCPVQMTALLGGAGADLWRNRIMRRKKYGGNSKL